MTAAARRQYLLGIWWMLVTGLFFVGVTGVVRHLGTDMNPMQAAFIRYAFGIVLIAPVLLRLYAAGNRPSRIGLHLLRGVAHGTAVMLWFFAMARIPIAQVTAIGFTTPIFTAIGAALYLGERLHARRIAAVVAAFLGTLVILRPGAVTIEAGALAQLAAAPLFAISFLIAKKLTETESSASIVAYMSVFVTIALLPPALPARVGDSEGAAAHSAAAGRRRHARGGGRARRRGGLASRGGSVAPCGCDAAAAAYVLLLAGSAAGGAAAGAGGAAGLALAGGSVACACRSWVMADSALEL